MSNIRNSKFLAIALLVLLSLGLLSACSGGGGGNAINAELTDYAINLSKSTANAGEVTFNVKNSANDIAHSFVVIKTDLDAANLPTDSAGNVDMSQLQSLGSLTLNPGESKDLTINMDAGHYAIICDLPGHYKMGMYTNFTVQ